MTTSSTASSAAAEERARARLEAHAAVHRWIEDALYGVLEALVARDIDGEIDGASTRFTRMRAVLEEHMRFEDEHVIPRYAPLAPKDGPGRLDHIAGDHTILIRNCDIAAGAMVALSSSSSLRDVLEQLPHLYRLIAALEHHTLREQNNVYGKIDAGDDVTNALKALVDRASRP